MILDLRLESADAGWRVLYALRANPRTRPTPVIICSANPGLLRTVAEVHSERNYLILAKPFDLATLLDLVGIFLPPDPHAKPARHARCGCARFTVRVHA